MKQTRDYSLFTVTKKGARWVEGGHPWIYAEEILSKSAEPENGALADAVSENGKYLGTGLYSRESKIGLRLVSRNANDAFDGAFWRRRVQYAWDYRKTVLDAEDLSCCRVIFGEADGFPGLTVDRFSEFHGQADPLRGDGAAEGHALPDPGGGSARRRSEDFRDL